MLSTTAKAPQTLTLTTQKGDIFAAPENTVLIHACNTQGIWGSGIAVPFKNTYPSAFKVYRAYCLSKTQRTQTGTCLLIKPCEAEGAPKHRIVCLFTSAKTGFRKDGPEEILKNTRLAVLDMLVKVKKAKEKGETVGALRMCKINSGKFGVEWERTEQVLDGIVVAEGLRKDIEIWDR